MNGSTGTMLTIRGTAGPQGPLALDVGGAGGVPVVFVHADAGNFTQWREALGHVRPTRLAVTSCARPPTPGPRDDYGSIAGPNPEVRGRVLWDVGATPPATVTGTFEALGANDPAPALAGYRGPRLSLVTPPNDTPASLHRLDPALPHRAATGTGHWLHPDDPDRFHGVLDEFLAPG